MAWPQGILGNKVEIYYDGVWNNVTTDTPLGADEPNSRVRGLGAEDGDIEIGPRGQPDEATAMNTTIAKVSVNNKDGKYSPRNTLSPLYGKIGRNTPLRILTDVSSTVDIVDSFDTNGSNGWPTADSGHTWVTTGGNASDYSVSAGSALHSHQAANVLHESRVTSTLDGDSFEITDFNCVMTGVVLEAAPTGANVEVSIKGRVTGTSYVEAKIVFTTANTVQSNIASVLNGVTTITSNVTLSGATASETISIRFQAKGRTLRVRIWETANEEPSTWDTTLTATHLAPGYISVTSLCVTGHSNAKPFDVFFGSVDFSLGIILFTGEVAGWPKRWDKTGSDVWVPLEISGVTRRLRQGNRPLRSAFFRQMSLIDPTGYWDFENLGPQPTAVFGGGGTLTNGSDNFYGSHVGQSSLTLGAREDIKLEWSADATLPGSDPLPQFSSLVEAARSMRFLGGLIEAPTGMTQFSVCFWAKGEPLTADDTGGMIQINIDIVGSAIHHYEFLWNHHYTGGLETLFIRGRGMNASGATFPIGAGEELSDALYPGDRWHFIRFLVDQNGGNIRIRTYVDEVEVENGSAGGTIGRGSGLSIDLTTYAGKGVTTSFGHFGYAAGVNTDVISANSAVLFEAGHGWNGEEVRTRFARLCEELGIPYEIVDSTLDDDEPTLCGPQESLNPIQLLSETVAVDDGLFYELRDDVGYGFRTLKSLYGGTSLLEIDYSAADLSEVPEVTDDDQDTRNIVGVKRKGGSEFSVRQTTGPLTPELIGDYEDGALEIAAFSDEQLPDYAALRVFLGTWDDSRWPGAEVAMHRSNFSGDRAKLAAAAFLEIGEVFSLVNNPVWIGPDDVLFLLRAISIQLSNFTWSIGYTTKPGEPLATINQMNNPSYGRVDTTGCTLLSAIDDNDTDIIVNTDLTETPFDTPVWTTDCGELDLHDAEGIDFRINPPSRAGGLGGERVRTGELAPVRDTFTRSVSQLGGSNADTGQTWATENGTATDATTDGSQLTLLCGTAGTQLWVSIPVSSADMCASADIAFNATTATAANLEAHLVVRQTAGSTSNNYRAMMRLNSGTSNLDLVLQKNIGGVVTQLGATVALGTNTANVPWRLKAGVVGTTIMAKAWLVGTDEPDWQIVVLFAASEVFSTSAGLRFNRVAGNTNVGAALKIDNFRVHTPVIASLFRDYFDRTVADGVGTATAGGAWTRINSGAYTSGDVSVAPNRVATIIPVANTYRGGYIDQGGTIEFLNSVVSLTWTCPTPTGAALEPGCILLRGDSATDWIEFRVSISTASVITISIINRTSGGGATLATTTVWGLAHAPATPLRTKAGAYGSDLMMKVWNPLVEEPKYWQLEATDPNPLSGFVGFRNGRATGNTNVNPTPTVSDFRTDTPQRITVERGINNAAREWSAGDDFRLWSPLRLGR